MHLILKTVIIDNLKQNKKKVKKIIQTFKNVMKKKINMEKKPKRIYKMIKFLHFSIKNSTSKDLWKLLANILIILYVLTSFNIVKNYQ